MKKDKRDEKPSTTQVKSSNSILDVVNELNHSVLVLNKVVKKLQLNMHEREHITDIDEIQPSKTLH